MTLDQLREKAENATPGPWGEYVADCDSFMSTFYVGKPNGEWPLKPDEVVVVTGCNGCAYGQTRDEDSAFIAAFNPEIALAFIEYVHANQKATVRLFGSMAEARAFNASEDRLFSLLGEQP